MQTNQQICNKYSENTFFGLQISHYTIQFKQYEHEKYNYKEKIFCNKILTDKYCSIYLAEN